MDIARAEPMGFDEKHRNHPNDGRVGFVRALEATALGDFQTEIDGLSDLLRQNVRRFVRGSVILDEGLPDFVGTGADQLDFALEKKAEAVDRLDIERIAYRDDQSALAEPDRYDLEAPRLFRSNLLDDFRRNDFRREIDPIHLRLRSQTTGDVGVRNDTVLDQQIDG